MMTPVFVRPTCNYNNSFTNEYPQIQTQFTDVLVQHSVDECKHKHRTHIFNNPSHKFYNTVIKVLNTRLLKT